MTTDTLKEKLIRELDHLSPEQLKAMHQLINTFKGPTAQRAPNQEAVKEVREALSSLSEPLSRTIENEREDRMGGRPNGYES